MLKTRRQLFEATCGAAAMLCASLPAAAHPHMCVAMETTVLYDKGAFTGVEQKWTFDQTYSETAVDGLDKNKDGKFDRAELAELAQVNIEALKDFDYFTQATVDGKPVLLGAPKDYWLEHKDGILSLHFNLPFAAPAAPSDKPLAIAVRDTSYYIAFGLPKDGQPARLGGGAPAGCRLAVETPDKEEQESATQILDALGCSIIVPKAIAVTCNGP
jgi:ABC-type uncharacterized transport system substrate-binding protein